jgi:predicted DNA-binding transcriptional regulator AlpA
MRQSQARALKIRDVEAVTKLTASTIRRLESRGEFPKRRRLGGSVFWLADEVSAFLESRPTVRDESPARA